jgi:hypothetical protein
MSVYVHMCVECQRACFLEKKHVSVHAHVWSAKGLVF